MIKQPSQLRVPDRLLRVHPIEDRTSFKTADGCGVCNFGGPTWAPEAGQTKGFELGFIGL